MSEGPRECACCGREARFTAVETIAFADIWAALERDPGLRAAPSLVEALTPATHTTLWECASCGHQVFAPCTPGTATFYEALSETERYYTGLKWEFAWVRGRLGALRTVLDVGCGPGDFLTLVSGGLERAAGLELNPAAASKARARGIEVHTEMVEDFGRREGRVFDAACSFHVLEHVEEPAAFARAMARCVRPGGRLFLSVPNRQRLYRATMEPLDLPPHHVSRWGAAQLRDFGANIGCPLVTAALEPASVESVRYVVEKRVARVAGAAAGWLVARALCPPGAGRVWEAAGLYDRLHLRGMSVVGEFSVP